MKKGYKILIGNRVVAREEWFKEKERMRKEKAPLPFSEKIRILIKLQELARNWGQKEDVIVWKCEDSYER